MRLIRLSTGEMIIAAHVGPDRLDPEACDAEHPWRSVEQRGSCRDRTADDPCSLTFSGCRDEFPDSRISQRGMRTFLSHSAAARRDGPIGVIDIRRKEVQPFHRQTDCAARNLCSTGRDRHRERAVV